jgi:predicted HD superfamily hydrolase involved in NAD metabolism
MWNEEEILKYLKKNLVEKRFKHTLGVVESSEKLANLYNENIKNARIAALLHDCAKNMEEQDLKNLITQNGYSIDEVCDKAPELLHGIGGSIIANKTIGVEDGEILDAIKYHTTGRKGMTKLEKIIYLADYIEPNRDFKGVESLRKLSEKDLDKAVVKALDNTITYVISNGGLLHIDTIIARNSFLLSKI